MELFCWGTAALLFWGLFELVYNLLPAPPELMAEQVIIRRQETCISMAKSIDAVGVDNFNRMAIENRYVRELLRSVGNQTEKEF